MPNKKVQKYLRRKPPEKYIDKGNSHKKRRVKPRLRIFEPVLDDEVLTTVNQVNFMVSPIIINHGGSRSIRATLMVLVLFWLIRSTEATSLSRGLTVVTDFDDQNSVIAVPKALNDEVFLARVVTMKADDCRLKAVGVSAGKICDHDGKTQFMKVIHPEGNDSDEHDRYSDPLTTVENFEFLKKLGVVTPEWSIVHQPGGQFQGDQGLVDAEWYLATDELKGFKSADKLLNRVKKTYHKSKLFNQSLPTWEIHFREQMLSNMRGEADLARLAVAGMFIHDLAINGANFGFYQNALAVVDADLMPKTQEEYFNLAAAMPRSIGIEFSMVTINHIYHFLESLLKSSICGIRGILLKAYVNAASKAIDKLNELGFINPDMSPNMKINDVFADQLVENMRNSEVATLRIQ